MGEPTELPEGTELVLAVVDDGEPLDDAERARLDESLRPFFTTALRGLHRVQV
jgi:hypothetical protein